MPPRDPIPRDLWLRLRALDGNCELALIRHRCQPETQGGWGREWIVSIRRFEGFEMVQHKGLALAEVLEAAVGEAERRGWAVTASPARPH